MDFAQVGKPQAIPEARIVRLTLDPPESDMSCTCVRGYVSCVRLPDDVSTVVLGNPSTFKVQSTPMQSLGWCR